MRPCPPTGGGRPANGRPVRPADARRASLLPLSSPRGVERNNKDTTNGARTLTAATDGLTWEKLRLSGLSCPSSGGCFPASSPNNALQHARSFVYNFFGCGSFKGVGGLGAGSRRALNAPV